MEVLFDFDVRELYCFKFIIIQGRNTSWYYKILLLQDEVVAIGNMVDDAASVRSHFLNPLIHSFFWLFNKMRKFVFFLKYKLFIPSPGRLCTISLEKTHQTEYLHFSILNAFIADFQVLFLEIQWRFCCCVKRKRLHQLFELYSGGINLTLQTVSTRISWP